MASVKQIMGCIGRDTSQGLSVLQHLFGFWRRQVPTDPVATAEVSVLDQVRGLQGRHLHLNVIAVGWWNTLPTSQQDTAREKIDYAIYRTRNIYAAVNLGVGRVNHYVITQDEADGAHDVGSEGEADELSDDWSVDNNGIDCFVVRTISADFVGISPVDGDCDKGGKRDGLVAGAIDRGGVTAGFDAFSRTFAHEIGHYLDLQHNHDDGDNCANCPGSVAACDNLMAQTRCANCCGNGVRAGVLLTSNQGSTMRGHCTTQSGC
jgi:hypothetical protein